MKWQKWLENWDMTSLKINLKFLEMNWEPKEPDKDAAWELYIELLTRITTQYLQPEEGDEKTALESVYKIFDLTRITIKKHKRDCIEFTKIAILVLNQIIRPFTAKWHKEMFAGAFEKEKKRKEFRDELRPLQDKLRIYTRMLADMAGVEDLTALEEV
jgi:hypothetical protein